MWRGRRLDDWWRLSLMLMCVIQAAEDYCGTIIKRSVLTASIIFQGPQGEPGPPGQQGIPGTQVTEPIKHPRHPWQQRSLRLYCIFYQLLIDSWCAEWKAQLNAAASHDGSDDAGCDLIGCGLSAVMIRCVMMLGVISLGVVFAVMIRCVMISGRLRSTLPPFLHLSWEILSTLNNCPH